MNDVSELLWGKDDKRVLLVRNMIARRARPKIETIIKSQKVGNEWVEVEVKQPEPETNEFQTFCQSYLENGVKWAQWVKDSPNLMNEAHILWSQLLLVAGMKDEAFEVPCRMLRQWQKVLSERILIL